MVVEEEKDRDFMVWCAYKHEYIVMAQLRPYLARGPPRELDLLY